MRNKTDQDEINRMYRLQERDFKRIKELEEERERWMIQILKVRDALLQEDHEEAYHQLYAIADSNFDQLNPWKDFITVSRKDE